MRRGLLTLVTAVAVMSAPVATAAVPDRDGRAGLPERLDRIVATDAVGAVAEVRDEHGVWVGTSGVAELGKQRPVPANSRFRTGSISKSFVATVVLQLVGEGRLRLGDPVESWLPGAVPNGRHITVRQLLDHTSGLYDVVRTLPMPPQSEFYANRWRTWTAPELIRRALPHPPTFRPPGSDYAYSNTNYLLLGQIIEQVTGRSYADEVGRRIIRPLRLSGTTLPGTWPRIRGPHLHGYVPARPDSESDLLDYTTMNPSLFGAAGEVISTASDLNRFFAALLDGRLLPAHLLEEMRTPGVEGATYGLGLSWRETPCGKRLYGHDGDALTYQSWSFATEDGQHQITIALTPNFRGDPDRAVDATLDQAVCG